jgi:hypothetical protein
VLWCAGAADSVHAAPLSQGCRALYCCCTAHVAGMWLGVVEACAAVAVLMQPAWAVPLYGCAKVGYAYDSRAVAVIWCHLEGISWRCSAARVRTRLHFTIMLTCRQIKLGLSGLRHLGCTRGCCRPLKAHSCCGLLQQDQLAGSVCQAATSLVYYGCRLRFAAICCN